MTPPAVEAGVTLGERLRWARETAGLSTGQLRVLLDWPPGRCLAVEDGAAEPTEAEVRTVADLCCVALPWLTTGEEREIPADLAARLLKLPAADAQPIRDIVARSWSSWGVT